MGTRRHQGVQEVSKIAKKDLALVTLLISYTPAGNLVSQQKQ